MINVLVTGASGQLGQCIKDLALDHSNINFIYTDYLELDICKLESVLAFFNTNKKIHYCINCAAYTAVDKAEAEVDKAFEINARGAKNLAIACSENNTVFIHVSTDFVFEGEKSEPYTVLDETNPISVYGTSKLQGEVEIQQITKAYFIIRTSWLYSEYGQNFMKTMLRLAETRTELNVVNDQIGTPTYAGDLAQVILKLVTDNNQAFGIYHYSNEGVVSWYDFAKAIFELSYTQIILNPITTKEYSTAAKRPMYSVLDKSKIKDELEVVIPFWKDSLKECLEKLSKNKLK